MSGIVGGYSVNNWLAASAGGYGLTSAMSLTDIGSTTKNKHNSSETSQTVQATSRFPDPFAGNTKRIDLTKRASSTASQVQSLLQRAQAELDKQRFDPAAISAQAQTLASIQPPQIAFSSADFAMLMEERDNADTLGQKYARQAGSQANDRQNESTGTEAENDGDSDDLVASFNAAQSNASTSSSNDPLAALHALFQTANTAYTAALHPPLPAAISLVS
jgi:hypothetical protein